jgi:Na+/H+-dicarboxylate symporter
MKLWTSIPLWVRILAAMLLGVGAGFALRTEYGVVQALGLDVKVWSDSLKLVGDGFIRLIQMLAVPLIFVSVTAAVVSIGDLAKLGKSGARVAALYIPSGFMAAALGIALGVLLQPGVGAQAAQSTPKANPGAAYDCVFPGGAPPAGAVDVTAQCTPKPAKSEAPTARTAMEQLIPSNPVRALAEGQMLSVIVFALLFGVGLLGAGAASKAATEAIEGAASAFMKLTGYIMELAPLGAFALMAWVVAVMGADALIRLSALVGCVYLGCAIYGLVVYGGFIRLGLNLPVIPYFRGMLEPMAVAYATASSSATLPVTMRAMVEKLGISRRMSAFVASLGATVNMDGTALYLALLTVFGAQLFGVALDWPQFIAIGIAATLGAIGAAGIPGGSVVFMPIVFAAAGVPVELIAIVLGVDRLMDMARTTLNVLGDSVAGVAVAKWEGELDLATYRGGKPQASPVP